MITNEEVVHSHDIVCSPMHTDTAPSCYTVLASGHTQRVNHTLAGHFLLVNELAGSQQEFNAATLSSN